MSNAPSRKRIPVNPGRTMKASEFKPKCLDVMDEVQARHIEVVITKRGKPVAKLVPAEDVAPDPVGFMRGTVLVQADIVSPDPEAWAEDDTREGR